MFASFSRTVVCAALLSAVAAETSAQTREQDKAYQVYFAALESRHAHTVFIRAETTEGSDACIQPNGPFAAKVREAIDERHRLGQQIQVLADRFGPSGAELVAGDRAREVSAKIAREEPAYVGTTLITFSPVGFSKDRSVAVLNVSTQCGQRCGTLASAVFFEDLDRWRHLPNQVTCSVEH